MKMKEKKFWIEWIEELNFRKEVKAKDKEEVREKFFNGDFDLSLKDMDSGSLVNGSLIITEIKD